MLPALLRRPLYYGWPMLIGGSTAQVVSWGILYYAFSVFITPMEAECPETQFLGLMSGEGAYGRLEKNPGRRRG
jgi:hypothetical protein